MSNAERILRALDSHLNHPVELTLYGRAALQLGFANPPEEYARTHDVDAVLWLGQAEELAAASNFWEAVERVNRELASQELYLSHFFEEDQVILRPIWRTARLKIAGVWSKLSLYRLGDLDLFLTKLMRDDPIDRADADFIIERAQFSPEQIHDAMRAARVPAIPEIQKQFAICSARFLRQS